MLAVAIFSMVAIGFMATLEGILQATIEARQEARVRRELQSYLAESRQRLLEVGRVVLSRDRGGVAYERDVGTVTLLNDRDEPMVFHKVRVSAKWVRGGREERRDAEILVYQP